ncbi:MAG: zinc ribbon domain-containing protein [Actinomycetota bacterium]
MKASKSAQEKLLALQALDSSLIQLEHKARNLPVSTVLDEKNLAFATARDLCVAAETEKSDIKHELSKSEIDVEQVVSRIERDEKRLASGQGSPKELEQLQHELGSLAKRRAELEEIELEVLVRIEALDLRISSLSKERDALHEEVIKFSREKEVALEEITRAISATTSDRQVLANDCEPELLALYEKIRASADGIGAARLHAGQCQGCNLTINAADLSKINALPDDEVVRCEECRRILVRM